MTNRQFNQRQFLRFTSSLFTDGMAMLHLLGSKPADKEVEQRQHQHQCEHQQQAAHEAKFQSLLLSSSFSSCDCCGSIIMFNGIAHFKIEIYAHGPASPGLARAATYLWYVSTSRSRGLFRFSRIFCTFARLYVCVFWSMSSCSPSPS